MSHGNRGGRRKEIESKHHHVGVSTLDVNGRQVYLCFNV